MLKFTSNKPYLLVAIEKKVSKEKGNPYIALTFATMGGKLVVNDFDGKFPNLEEDKEYNIEVTLENYGSMKLKRVWEDSSEVKGKK